MIAVSYTFSKLLHSVLKFQYSPPALSKSASAFKRRDRLQTSSHILEQWVAGLPAPLNEAPSVKTLQGFTDDKVMRKILRVFCMYHQAVFLIYCPWISFPSSHNGELDGVAAQMRERCVEKCVESAFAVVKLADIGSIWEKGLDGYVSFLHENRTSC